MIHFLNNSYQLSTISAISQRGCSFYAILSLQKTHYKWIPILNTNWIQWEQGKESWWHRYRPCFLLCTSLKQNTALRFASTMKCDAHTKLYWPHSRDPVSVEYRVCHYPRIRKDSCMHVCCINCVSLKIKKQQWALMISIYLHTVPGTQ